MGITDLEAYEETSSQQQDLCIVSYVAADSPFPHVLHELQTKQLRTRITGTTFSKSPPVFGLITRIILI